MRAFLARLMGWRKVVGFDEGLMPPPPRIPKVPIQPPRGFRFASTPPRVDDLVHLDNDHAYRRARSGETLLILKGPIARIVLGHGRVVGRMGSRDPRARLVSGQPSYPAEGYPGIYFTNEHGENEWRPAQDFWRRNDSTLTFTR